MNQNDMDRYFWRTGERWGDGRRPHSTSQWTLKKWEVVLLGGAFIATAIFLFQK